MTGWDSIKIISRHYDACLKDCLTIEYQGEMAHGQLEVINQDPRTQASFVLSLKSKMVEIHEEFYLYDFAGMVGSVGGALGLFLGFSFLDCLCKILDFLS